MKYIRSVNGPIAENAYIVYDELSKIAGIIDPGFIELSELADKIEEYQLNLKYIINTHGHWDHIKNNYFIKSKYNCSVLIHKQDEHFIQKPENMNTYYFDGEILPVKADEYLIDGEEIAFGKSLLKILHTPGHTRGSVILYNDELAFTGDTLFYGSIGRCDFPTGNKDVMIDTLEKIKRVLPATAIILPGHGVQESLFQEELVTNPFLTGKMKPR